LYIISSLSVNHDFSIIIGLKDTRASQLVLDFLSRFNTVEELALEGAQVKSNYTQLLDSTVKSAYTPLADNTLKTDTAYTPLAQSGPIPNRQSEFRFAVLAERERLVAVMALPRRLVWVNPLVINYFLYQCT
jgi:hypothetical protein